jgi:GH25 family lysozyme M1 (1,4-beta-N-acetylmuramidase)
MAHPCARLLAVLLALAAFGALGAVAGPVAHASTPTPTGIDISRWQHPNGHGIDWSAVRGAGHSFAIIKATESNNYTNPYFASDTAGARSVGMMVGAYDFARPSRPVAADAAAEARYFVGAIGSTHQAGTLPPVLDMEQSGGLSSAELIAWTHTWLDTVTALTGRMPIVYTYKNFWSTNMAGTSEFGAYPLWLAYYSSTLGGLVGNWPTWAMWQYSSSGSVPGISGSVDMNRFNGSLADLAALANGAAISAFGPSSPFPPVNVATTSGDRTARVSWTAGNNGGAPITSYTATVQPGGQTQKLPASATSATFAGLTNGTAYTITVRAANALGSSDPVAAHVTPNVQTTLRLTGTVAAVSYGGRMGLTARLTRNDTGAPLAGRTVYLEGHTGASTVFTSIGRMVTDAKGVVATIRIPQVSTTYRLRYAGGTEAASSTQTTVLVRPVLSGKLNHTAAHVGSLVIMSGSVSPLRSGYVYRQQLISGVWTTLDRAAISRTGSFSFRLVPVSNGAKSYRLYVPQSVAYGLATSATIPLAVR